MSESPAQDPTPTRSFDAKLERIRRLIAIASDERANPHERESAQRSAERLMVKYSVEEWQIAQAGGRNAAAAKPERVTGIYVCPTGHHCRMYLANLAMGIGSHLNVSTVFSGLGSSKNYESFPVTVSALGFPNDLRMWESLFTMLHLQLLSEIDPRVDYAETFDANVYRLHLAGISWPEIAERMNRESDGRPVEWPPSAARDGRLKRSAKREATLRGETYEAIASPVGYQRSFASSFVVTVLDRFSQARSGERTSGTELVLADKFAEVLKLQEELYPDLTTARDPSNVKFSAEGWERGNEAGRRANLNLDPTFGAKKNGAIEV